MRFKCDLAVALQDQQASSETSKCITCKPSFLWTMLKEIVLAGKSMELLTTLGQRVDILRGKYSHVTVSCRSVQVVFCIIFSVFFTSCYYG